MYDYKDKKSNINLLNKYMLLKSLSMFSYEGLPATMNLVALEKSLQQNGYVFVTEVEGELYSFNGNLGGELDVYGEPTEITINNVALKFNKTLNIENDGVLIRNDDLMIGLLPLYNKYHSLLIENEVTMYLSSFNARINTLISAGDDKTEESARLYLEKIIAGELGIIGESQLFDGLKAQTTSNTSRINMTELIEFNQYLKATLFNEIGLDANFNMKRERLNSSEVAMNSDGLFPLVDNMLDNRVIGINKLNEKYGLNIKIDFDSSWKKEDKELNEVDAGVSGQHEDGETVSGQHEDDETVSGQHEDGETVSGQHEDDETVSGQDESDDSDETDETDESDEPAPESDVAGDEETAV